MIERLVKVCRNARTAYTGEPPPLVDSVIVQKVLQALMEPTPEMCEAAWMYSQGDPNEAKGCWQEMLKEAMRSGDGS